MRSNKVLLSDTMILTEFILKSDILRRPQKFENVPLFLLMLLCKFKNKWLISSNFEGLLTISELYRVNTVWRKIPEKNTIIFLKLSRFFYLCFSFLLWSLVATSIFFGIFFFCYWRFVLAYCQKKNPEEKRPGLNYSWFTQLTYLICG